ncbi:MAG: oligosaccharide flippase family protein [Sulfuriferula sp.]
MTTDSISSRSTKAFSWGVAGAVGRVAGQLVVQITLARILDPVVFGQYAAMLAVFGLGYILADGGFGSSLVHKKELSSADVSLALGWSLAFASAMALLIFLLAPLLAHQFGDASLELVFRVCAIFIPFQIVSNISSSLLRRDLHMKGIQIIQLIAYIVCFGGVSTTMAIMGWGVWSLVGGFAAQTIFSLVATYSISRHTLRPRLSGDRVMIHFGVKSLATELTRWSMDNLDRFLVGKFWGLYSLGLYSVAFNLSKAPSGLLVSVAQSVAFASASRLHGNLAAVRKGFLVVLAAIALVTLPLFALVALESASVLHIVYGAKWVKAAPYMAALAISVPLISMGAITAAILRGTGSVGTELRIQMATAVVLFSGFLILQSVSLALAVWVVPLAYLVRLLLLLAAIREHLELRVVDLLAPFRGAFVLAVAGVCVTVLVHGLPPVTVIGMDVLPLLAGCSAIVLLFAFGFTWFLGVPLATMVHTKFSAGRFGPFIVWLERGKY